jgi:hypothetical protein
MPEPLLGARARDELLAFTSGPTPDVDLIYVEYRVSSDAAETAAGSSNPAEQVDVSFSAAGHAARAALAAHVRRLAQGQAAPGAAQRWSAAADCLERWATRGTEEARALRAACLEYDIDPGGAVVAEPSLFFNAHELSHAWDRPRTLAGLRRAVTWLVGERAPALSETIERVLGALPENYHLAHLGFMIPRPDESLRFCLALPRPELDGFLQRVGWGGSLAEARDFVALAERGGWVSVALGMGPDGAHPRLGIEAPVQGHPGGAAALIAALVGRGSCTPAKANALLALLAPRGARGDEAEGDRYELSHAKLVVSPHGSLETKAYVTLAPSEATMGRLSSIRQIRARAALAMPAGG